ncbi:hypothetical protein PALB_23600 [Pseudoalteromonas luteoviolacea B = ATCC 29581]|nr:hypothetical protein PALB_23600 [Pseudoalteromonas luteoviolacea B = ATCC 29581]
MFRTVLLTLFVLFYTVGAYAEESISTQVSLEQRLFWQSPVDPEQHSDSTILSIETEYAISWLEGTHGVIFTPFIQLDTDSIRDNTDVRELLWTYRQDTWEVRSGVGKVFWGQTESMHLVDIVNQTDLSGGVDGEDKLGQPMINIVFSREWGSASFFILPYFREREFPDSQGRLRYSVPVVPNRNEYEAGDEEHHLDLASRWHYIEGNAEVALSYFDGTSREPSFYTLKENDELGLVAFYPQVQQFGLESLYIDGSWIWKFEGIYRTYTNNHFHAMVAGVEYTQYGIFYSGFDLGWIVEYQFDSRDQHASAIGQNDLMLGARIVFNDLASTEVLIGFIQDMDDSSSHYGFIEASGRLSDSWKFKMESWFFSAKSPIDPLRHFERDNFLQASLHYYF